MATYTIRNTSVQDWRDTMMSKAQFDALAAERRANRAGSGFDEWGKVYSGAFVVNEGMWVGSSVGYVNRFILGNIGASQAGLSRTSNPMAVVNGTIHNIGYVNYESNEKNNQILLPPAPTVLPYNATLTTEQIAMGVIKHADASNSGLIVNGKFDMDTSGWSNFDASLSIDANRLKITSNAGSTSGTFGIHTLSNLVVGKKYIVEFNVISISSGSLLFRVGAGTATQPFNYIHSVTPTIGRNSIEFTATLTNHHIFMGLVTSAGQNAIYDNIAVFPSDAISRSDLVFLETWHEDVSEKDFVYPLGNVQYLGTTGDSGIPVAGAFAGSATYSLFSDTWQADSALVGKGYVWSTLSDANKKAFVANPENNCYLDGDKIIQVRYRMRVVAGMGDSWANVNSIASVTEGGGVSLTASRFGAYSLDGTVKPKGKKVSLDINIKDIDVYTAGMYMDMGNSSTTYNKSGLVNIGAFTACSSAWTLSTTFGHEGKCYALPIALVHRRNSGIAHSVFNSNGSKLASDSLPWYSTTVSFTSIADCFDSSKLLIASGYIGTSSGRPDGLFYDQVHEADILDLRNSSAKVEDYSRLIDREFNKLVAGTYRGSEGEWGVRVALQTTDNASSNVIQISDTAGYLIGDTIQFFNSYDSSIYRVTISSIVTNSSLTYVNASNFYRKTGYSLLISGKTTRTKSNTLTHTDIIGSPANYPTVWKQSGVFGVPLITAEDGASMLPTGTTGSDGLAIFKNSRKVTIGSPVIYQILKSIDNGVTWALLVSGTHYTFSTTTNAIAFTAGNIPLATDLVMVTYQTHTNMAIAGVNSEVLAIGDVFVSNSQYTTTGNTLINSLLGKIPVGTTAPVSVFNGKCTGYKFYSTPTEKLDIAAENKPAHTTIPNLGTVASHTAKAFPYLTRSNGKARLQLVFKEMKYSTANADWGDDSTFNIVDNVSTTTDWYGSTVLIGQKYAELPYFISAGE